MSTVIEPNAAAAPPANAAEGAFPEPETGLEARGAASGGSDESEAGTGQANAGNDGRGETPAEPKAFGFTSALAAPFVPLKLAFPSLWPDTAVRPLFFKLDYLLSEEADSEQAAFLKLEDAEQAAETYRYDSRMLALLSVAPPEGFLDFEPPDPPEVFDSENPEHRKRLANALFTYLHRPGAENEKAFRFIARQFMSRYWSRVMPREYL